MKEERVKIKIEEDVFWKELKKENIKGNIYCPICGETLIVIPAPYVLFGYCPTCRKYYEAVKKCRRCGTQYNVNQIRICGK